MNRYRDIKVGERELVLYLPPSYEQTSEQTSEQSSRSYPVVYVQDGEFLFDGCISYLEHLYASGALEELILVGIRTELRNDEYTPWPTEALVPGMKGFGGKGEAYVNEVADVIKPYIDRHYRTQKDAVHTAMIGGSFGGLISLFAGYWRPDTFGRLGLLSASFWYEGLLDYIQTGKGLDTALRIYMSVGLCEGIYKQNIQRNMVPFTHKAASFFIGKGFPEESLRLVTDPQGTHDDVFMIQQFPKALQWLFNGKQKERLQLHSAAKENPGSFRIPGTRVWEMRSTRTGRKYRISVAEPTSQPLATGYPVLYALDANASFGSLAESLRLQSRGPHGIPPVLVVGIGYDSEDPIVTDQRFYDYTVHADESELPARPGGSPWPETGGADDFLAFIEEQLKPEIERRYPVDRSRQSLFGHSLGGFLALYSLFTTQGNFQRYISASPSVWWKNHFLYTKWSEMEERLKTPSDKGSELLIVIGLKEKSSMVQDARNLYDLLKDSGRERGIHTILKEVPEEGHVSVIPAMISPMLRFVTK